jgi:hypothetical protein
LKFPVLTASQVLPFLDRLINYVTYFKNPALTALQVLPFSNKTNKKARYPAKTGQWVYIEIWA